MMLGLESWIPIYMTGRITPHYFKNNKTNIYNHFNYVSGSVALTEECINGFHNKGEYYLYAKQRGLSKRYMNFFRKYVLCKKNQI